jgi:hypothetical protein
MSGAGVVQWLEREQLQFAASRPRSRALFAAGERHYLYGAPMHWMRRWAGGFPLYAQRASGTRLWCVDGFEHGFRPGAPAQCVVMRRPPSRLPHRYCSAGHAHAADPDFDWGGRN